jgi:DNA (cytosine-5)-methyltransferase 1
MTTRYTTGSLCTGYGGLDIGIEAVYDTRTIWHAETEPAAAQLLAERFPGVPNIGDITAVDWASVPPVDILTAGFPCQPISHAGKRKGQDDERWIWPSVATAVGVLRPRLAVFENVAAITVRGLEPVLADLAALGFDAEWTCLPASAIGAPHRRERWFCLAWPADPQGPRLETRR